LLTTLQTVRQFAWPRAWGVRPSDQRLAREIVQRQAEAGRWPDRQLPAALDELRRQVQRGASCRDPGVMGATFTLVAEATGRVLAVRLYDVQLLAGLALAQGAIAEMATGEGKTLAAALPAALYALAGRGVHVVTPNSYLAARDYQLLEPVWRLLGVSAGLLREGATPQEKQAAYACDVTYGTGYEFGFDYLRDQLAALRAFRPALGQRYRQQLQGRPAATPGTLQRGHAVAIIDEIDSVLLDEAGLPLVLSDRCGEEDAAGPAYAEAQRLCSRLAPGQDFVIRQETRSLALTEQGVAHIHPGGAGPLPPLKRPWSVYVQQALAARWLFKRDVDYLVKDGKLQMVDEFTGRVHADRFWRDGLHQALEVKEGLAPSAEFATAARISRQRYFRLYATLCGMTGTASGSQREFWRLYRFPVVVIPLQKACRRALLPTRYFVDGPSKWRAVVAAVRAIHATGRPLLIGSRTIENSQELARRLAAEGIPHQLLNGKQDQDEAAIVAGAGQMRAVTIATNMAGRGTDIQLGRGVAQLGGLHVIGVERHESARIDRQLLGRAGRQGDPGSGQFFVSAEDSLIGRFAPALQQAMRSMGAGDGEIHADLGRELAAAQRRAEKAGYLARCRLLAHDHWLDQWLAALAKDR
jgi:preprotein translocase subunit SecA